jgi:hypothetical protein
MGANFGHFHRLPGPVLGHDLSAQSLCVTSGFNGDGP